MTTLRVEHATPDFDTWKRVFDSDPVDRKGSGVSRYRILRSVEDPNFVMIDLEFGNVGEAEAMLGKLKQLWAGPGKDVMLNPTGRIVETAEAAEV